MAMSQTYNRFGTPKSKLLCLEGALGDGNAAALALAGDDFALMVYDPAKLGALHASWRSIFQ